MNKFFDTVKQAASDFSDDDCMSSGAAIAYYTIFSLPPILVIVFLVAGYFGVSHQRVEKIVSEQLGLPTAAVQNSGDQPGSAGAGEQQAAGESQVASVAGVERSAEQQVLGEGNLAGRIVGLVVLLFSATGVLAQLQYTLNRVWEVEPDPKQGGVMSFLAKRVLSLGMIAVVAFLLLVSMVLTTLIDELTAWLRGGSPDTAMLVISVLLNNLVTLLVAMLLFAAMYKILPDVKMSWKDVWIGAGITALLFVIGKALIGWYLQYSQTGSEWGSAAASMIAVLVWVYYTSLIVLFGAELTQVWANRYGSGIEPADGAVRTVREKAHLRGAEGHAA